MDEVYFTHDEKQFSFLFYFFFTILFIYFKYRFRCFSAMKKKAKKCISREKKARNQAVRGLFPMVGGEGAGGTGEH